MAPTRTMKAPKKIGGAQATLNFRRTKSSSGPSSSTKEGKVVQGGTPILKKGSALKNIIRASDDSDSDSSDEEEPELPSSVVSTTKEKAKQQQQPKSVVREPRKDLDVRKYGKLYGLSRAMTNGLEFIHDSDQTQVHHILRTFDLSYQYGPCIGMTRLERWLRAEEMGLNPPEEIKEILETKQGVEEEGYRECVFFEEV